MTVEEMKNEWDLQETEYIQLNMDRQHAIMERYPKWHTKWSLLKDPVGRGMTEVLSATIQNVRAQRKELKKSRKVIPLDPFQMQTEYTVLSAQLTKLVDKQERSYQRIFLNSICGQGELLNSTNHILDTIEEMGQTHRQHKRRTHTINRSVYEPSDSIHPWLPLNQQTKLLEQEVPSFFQEGNLQTQYVTEEEVLQTTTCSTRDLQEDMQGWKKAFTNELDSFERLNVKTDVWEHTLDLRSVEILPGKVVMVKKPIGLKNNEMTQLKAAKGLPCVDEKSPPEEAYDEHGHPTSFEEDKSMCQKYIGQLMWLTTRTRPDIAAVLGILASQMVIRPTYIRGCLVLILNVYVDASFASGGGRSRSGLAMYLVNPSNGKESIIQWASRRQTSMATSAPEAEVSAMAEGFAASIFLFDTLSEIGLVSGTGPSSIMSMKTDSAVALKQLGTQSVTVRTRTAAQKLNYLRELIYDDPQVEPIHISGDSQRADGLTKILSGSALRECQKGLNLLYPSAQKEVHVSHEEKPAVGIEQARIGACIVSRQVGTESSSLDSTQDGSKDNSDVLAPVCFACQEGQDQDQDKDCKSMCIICCFRSHYMVHESKAGANRRKGRPGGEAPEGRAQPAGPAHGSGQTLKQEIAQQKMKALQHTEVPSSSTSSSTKPSKAKGKQTSQPKQAKASIEEHHTAELAMSQESATELASAAATAGGSPLSSSEAAVAAIESASSVSELALVLETALGTVSQDVEMAHQLEKEKQASSQSWADITAQDEEEEQKSKTDQDTGVQTGNQELAWSRVLTLTDEDLRTDTSSVDRSRLNTYHFDPSLVNTSPQETSFDRPADLPAWAVREEFLNKLNTCKFLVVKAPTGSGKSTIFPALVAKVMPHDRVMCTQVKRNTTEAVCQSTRKMWGRSPQDLTVGFKHEMSDKQASANEKTRILFCTEGIARNEILSLDRTKISDTAIRGCRILVVDEAHSSNVDTELIIASVLTRLNGMKNFKLVVMSATLDVSSFYQRAYDAGLDRDAVDHMIMEERTKTIEHFVLRPSDTIRDNLEMAVRAVVQFHNSHPKVYKKTTEGTMLVFVSGKAEIAAFIDILTNLQNRGFTSNLYPYAFHADLSYKDKEMLTQYPIRDLDKRGNCSAQRRALQNAATNKGWEREGRTQRTASKPDYTHWSQRNVIVATNAAETGVTFERCILVVDTCLVNVIYHDPSTNVKVQATMPCSKAASEQRAGRTGRDRDGQCIRLVTQDQWNRMPIRDPIQPRLIDHTQLYLRLSLPDVADLRDILLQKDFYDETHETKSYAEAHVTWDVQTRWNNHITREIRS